MARASSSHSILGFKVMSTENGEFTDCLVSCQNSLGLQIHATLVRLTRYLAIFEVYNPAVVLRTSEVLSEFRIVVHERVIYSGRAVVRNLLSTGAMTVCEVALQDTSWMDVDFTGETLRSGKLREQFSGFIQEWQKLYKVESEYKVIIA